MERKCRENPDTARSMRALPYSNAIATFTVRDLVSVHCRGALSFRHLTILVP